MKKNIFNWMAIFMIGFLCVGLSACGGDDNDNPTPPNKHETITGFYTVENYNLAFYDNNTFSAVDKTSGKQYTGTYTYNAPDLILSIATRAFSLEEGKTYNFSVVRDGDNFILTNKDTGEKFTMTTTQKKDDDEKGKAESITYLTCPNDNHPHLIDLGLPSGTKWACCNVGAKTPEDYGGYYAWGETTTKSEYNWNTYKYGYYNRDNDYSHLVNIGSDIAGTQYDAATVNWGAPWKMPSIEQIQELLNNCTSEFTIQKDVSGRKFTGSNGGTIFIPAAKINNEGSAGEYWSSTLNVDYPYVSYVLYFNSDQTKWDDTGRYRGENIRPIYK